MSTSTICSLTNLQPQTVYSPLDARWCIFRLPLASNGRLPETRMYRRRKLNAASTRQSSILLLPLVLYYAIMVPIRLAREQTLKSTRFLLTEDEWQRGLTDAVRVMVHKFHEPPAPTSKRRAVFFTPMLSLVL